MVAKAAHRGPSIPCSSGQQGELYKHNLHLQEKYDRITAEELRWETNKQRTPEIVVVAYGTAARIAESATEELKAEGIRAGLFRPITLWPFPLPASQGAVEKGPQNSGF